MGQEPDQLKQEIEATRAELGRDVDALADKVSPKRVVERRVDSARGAVTNVKEKVMGSASDARSSTGGALSSAAGSVGGTASSAVGTVSGTASGAVSGARSKTQGNPLAAGVIAFGAGWLVASLLPASDKERQAAARMTEVAKEKAQPLAQEVGQAARAVADDLKEPARQAAESVRGTATEAAGTVADEGKGAVSDIRGQTGSGDDDELTGAWGTPGQSTSQYGDEPPTYGGTGRAEQP